MANFRYFAEVNGQTVRLSNVQHDGHVSTRAHHFSGTTPDGARVQCDRMIQRKSNPSLHECGPRCLAATGLLCECSCGGKNHGKGAAVVQGPRRRLRWPARTPAAVALGRRGGKVGGKSTSAAKAAAARANGKKGGRPPKKPKK